MHARTRTRTRTDTHIHFLVEEALFAEARLLHVHCSGSPNEEGTTTGLCGTQVSSADRKDGTHAFIIDDNCQSTLQSPRLAAMSTSNEQYLSTMLITLRNYIRNGKGGVAVVLRCTPHHRVAGVTLSFLNSPVLSNSHTSAASRR